MQAVAVSTKSFFLAVVLGLGVIASTRPARAAESPPRGFRQVAVPGPGTVWETEVRQAPSVAAAARFALKALGRNGFATVPRPLGGLQDRRGTLLQVAFRARRGSRWVAGLLAAAAPAAGAPVRILVAFDDEKRAARTVPRLLARLGRTDRAETPYQPRRWYRAVHAGGTIMLPVGWRVVSSYQGAVDVIGPEGGEAHLGIGFPVCTPAAAWGPARPALMAPAGLHPVQALRALAPQFQAFQQRYMPGGPVLTNLRILEAQETQSPTGGRAAFVVFDYLRNGRPYRAVGLFDCSPAISGWWTFYSSTVAAPRESFARLLPVLLRIWANGWQIDPRVFRERLVKASRTLREAYEGMNRSWWNRQRRIHRALTDFSEVFRGGRILRDVTTGEEATVDIGWVDRIAEKMNEREGWKRYVPIPLKDWWEGR